MRCWRAKTDGSSASTFHNNCDGKGPTVTIIRAGQNIFGGYTDVSWRSTYISDIIIWQGSLDLNSNVLIGSFLEPVINRAFFRFQKPANSIIMKIIIITLIKCRTYLALLC